MFKIRNFTDDDAGDGGAEAPNGDSASRHPSEADLFMAARDLPPIELPESRSALLEQLRGQPIVRNGIQYVYRPRVTFRPPGGGLAGGRAQWPGADQRQSAADRADAPPPGAHGGRWAVITVLAIIGSVGLLGALLVALTAGGGQWYAAQSAGSGVVGSARGATGGAAAAEPTPQTNAPGPAASATAGRPAWSVAECSWAIDTLALDARLDQATAESAASAASRVYYAEWAGTWQTVGGLAAHTCGRPSPVSVDPASECSWAVERLTTAAAVHRAWADNGDHIDFNRSWAAAYDHLVGLFQRNCA